jgi:hypothetical protein
MPSDSELKTKAFRGCQGRGKAKAWTFQPPLCSRKSWRSCARRSRRPPPRNPPPPLAASPFPAIPRILRFVAPRLDLSAATGRAARAIPAMAARTSRALPASNGTHAHRARISARGARAVTARPPSMRVTITARAAAITGLARAGVADKARMTAANAGVGRVLADAGAAEDFPAAVRAGAARSVRGAVGAVARMQSVSAR